MGLTTSRRPLRVWAVSDGRAGIEAQALGLAEALSRQRPADVSIKRVGWRWGLGRLPYPIIPPAARRGNPIGPPWPDLWIATGRATLPLSTRVRAWSGGRTFVVQTQDPRAPLSSFDLVIPPDHDQLSGSNVFSILGAPTRLDTATLAAGAARIAGRVADLPSPRVAVIIGGRSRAHDLPADHARDLAIRIADAARSAGASLMVSFTRRTPPAARAAIAETLADVPAWIWNDEGENPYAGFLGLADAVLVTADSANLATDAAATGKPVFILPVPGRSAKLERLHAALAARGVAQPFNGRFQGPTYLPLAETARAAAEVWRRYDLWKGTAGVVLN
ncbi:mitochondrial fission ELM1 family protein [Phenylobacterium sp.]|uniref:mitochondrial fission ELM1 family protein n=1 Tax=Phenylobacterium sp. TaxID=1871053 RepID=UPI0037C57025